MKMKAVLAAALAASVAPLAHAAGVNYSNVGVSTSSSCQLSYNCSGSQQFSSSTGYDFVYSNWTAATTTGAKDSTSTMFNPDYVVLGTANHNAAATTSPFLALDSDYPDANHTGGAATINDVSGLTIGDTYTINFNTADAQQTGYNGPSDDQVKICLGTQCFTTADVVDSVTGGSTGWVSQSYTFTATGTDEAFSLLGIGGNGSCSGVNCSTYTPLHNSQVPAFALVDDLSITQNTPSPTPEPSSLALLGTGLAGLGGLVRSRMSKSLAARSL